MDDRKPVLARLSEFVHDQFIWLVIASYAGAAFSPAFGLGIREVSFGTLSLFHERLALTLPSVLLALLLLNAGLGVQTSHLRQLFQSPLVLVAGLLANLVIPLTFILGVTLLMRGWHNPDEVQNVLVGLALVAAMPIAGSSTAWSQNANGNLALSLGLVLGSTFLSPLTTPLALHAVGLLASGDYAEDLHELAAGGTGGFLAVAVLLPSLLGILLHGAVGETHLAEAKPLLKLTNAAVLLLLTYSNAALSLPETVTDPDWDFLAVVLGMVVSLCVLSFAAGGWIARLVRAEATQRTSLMFGLGMNNNGTGLVLASLALADHPRVLLPILFYNLVQHLAAGAVDFVLRRRARADRGPAPKTSAVSTG
jgi:BASS family bile acid:Na+ symporter